MKLKDDELTCKLIPNCTTNNHFTRGILSSFIFLFFFGGGGAGGARGK